VKRERERERAYRKAACVPCVVCCDALPCVHATVSQIRDIWLKLLQWGAGMTATSCMEVFAVAKEFLGCVACGGFDRTGCELQWTLTVCLLMRGPQEGKNAE